MFCAHCGFQLPDGAEVCARCGKPVPAAETAAPRRTSTTNTIIVALVALGCAVIAFFLFAVFLAVAIPNFLHARAEAMTQRDVGNEKQIAIALENFHVENRRYPKSLKELIPRYLAALPTVPGTDPAKPYAYHAPASNRAYGAFDIWDDGSMDPTTLNNVGASSTISELCTELIRNHCYVVYGEATGPILHNPKR